uniref:Galactose oxidase n=1 Tax=Anthurium amnicola TaxID=1678845 RepID=A0A1D1Y096_9ARAE
MIIRMKNYFLLFIILVGGLLLLSINDNVSAYPSWISNIKRQAPAAAAAPTTATPAPPLDAKVGGTWEIQKTQTGVNAMHMFVASVNRLVYVDKLENNPLLMPSGQSALSATYNLDTDTLSPLVVTSDTFCSAGSWLGNGTLVHTGGDNGNAQFSPGQQTLRFYDPAVGNWVEKVGIMPSKRWYPTMLPLVNGKVLILGGSTGGVGLNTAALNNPTYNMWPPSNGVSPDPDVTLPFLTETLPYNLYVFCHIVPNANNQNLIFMLANTQPILYDLDNAKVITTYPKIATQRTYPQTGTSLMLPLYPETNYKAEIMVCGGQDNFEPTSTASATCGRMDLTVTTPAWVMDDFGGIPRCMPDSVILPNGQVLFLNGAQTGYAGFRKGNKANPLWVNSNPAFTPVLYDVNVKTYTKMNPSTIARMYHSVASLTADGYVFVAGSNPQASVQTGILFSTEYRAEKFTPPYLLTGVPRPTIVSINGNTVGDTRTPVGYNQQLIFVVSLPQGTTNPSFTSALIHLGFVTHSQNMGQRYVGLTISQAEFDSQNANQYILTLTTPPNPTIIAPGPHYIYILNNGSPCTRAVEVLLN